MTGTVLDLFAGPGGWSQGLKALGRTEVGIELDEAACETARAAGHGRYQADIATLEPTFGGAYPKGKVDGLIASPPCPGFSAAGKGLGKKDLVMLLDAIEMIGDGQPVDVILERVRGMQHDPRSALTLEPLRWALALEPTWLAWEQVPAVLPLWEACAVVLRARGWNVWVGCVQAEQYGVPQTRKRAILRAHRERQVGLPTPTHSRFYSRDRTRLDPGVLKWVSMAEALTMAGLPLPGELLRSNYGTGGDPAARGERLVDEPAPTVTSKVDRNLWQLVNNNTAHAAVRTTEEPAPTVHFSQRMNAVTWQPVAANEGTTEADMAWVHDRPSPTIVGSFAPDVVAAPGYRGPGDGPRQKAKGSVRVSIDEAAVLQSFPVGYPWNGGKRDSKGPKYRQVGDAMPCLLAAAVLRDLL